MFLTPTAKETRISDIRQSGFVGFGGENHERLDVRKREDQKLGVLFDMIWYAFSVRLRFWDRKG